MKKRYKKLMKTFLGVILVIILAIGAFLYFSAVDSLEDHGIVKNSIDIDVSYNLRNTFIILELNGSNIDSPVTYYVKNPSGDILDKGELTKDNNNIKLDKKYKGQKGVWKIEFSTLPTNGRITYGVKELTTNLWYNNKYK